MVKNVKLQTKPTYEPPKVSKLDNMKGLIGGVDLGDCLSTGSSAIGLCVDGGTASETDINRLFGDDDTRTACNNGIAPNTAEK